MFFVVFWIGQQIIVVVFLALQRKYAGKDIRHIETCVRTYVCAFMFIRMCMLIFVKGEHEVSAFPVLNVVSFVTYCDGSFLEEFGVCRCCCLRGKL